MEDKYNLQRFLTAQNTCDQYNRAVRELLDGRKQSHWVWFVLPQVKGLGYSYNSQFYGISGIEEAKAYLADEDLSFRLRRVTEILIQWAPAKSMTDLLGHIDAMKAKSCLTLFDLASPGEFFENALNECFGGERDEKTIEICKGSNK